MLAWDRAGRWVAGATLLVAAVYELTPLKDVCLGKCRSPLGFLLGSWRDGRSGALRMGAKNGAWCVGCCWALMASLFALGVMSLVWMAFVAGLIAVEKLLPWRRVATYGTAALLLALGVLLLVAPHAIPGLTIPGGMMSPSDGLGPAHALNDSVIAGNRFRRDPDSRWNAATENRIEEVFDDSDQRCGVRFPESQASGGHRGLPDTINHGSNVVYKRLRDRGYEVFAVNPNAEEVEGDRAYHDLRAIPGGSRRS